MNMNIKELGEKYGFNQEVHLSILDRDIDQLLAEDGVTPDRPDYLAKKLEATKMLQELFYLFLDCLERIALGLEDGFSPAEIRTKMTLNMANWGKWAV